MARVTRHGRRRERMMLGGQRKRELVGSRVEGSLGQRETCKEEP